MKMPDRSYLTQDQFDRMETLREKYPMFYNVADDLKAHPDCIVILVQGGRGTGKTYSALEYMLAYGEKFTFMKRTNKDVNLMCGSLKAKKDQDERFRAADLSPFKSINRDIGCNIKAFQIFDGFGGFWLCTHDDEPIGDPIGYIVSFNIISKIRGFDLSDCDYIIFDEFVPKSYERINRNEGIELLDFYLTVERANNLIYGKALKMILLSNADTISCPVTTELELVDTLAQMQADKESEKELSDRSIFIRRIPDISGFREAAEKNPIYKVTAGTKWKQMSLENDYAYNDFTNVKRVSLKGKRCIFKVKYRENVYYCYVGESGYYMTYTKSEHYDFCYDLNTENDQKLFYYDQVQDLQSECIEGRVAFQTFQMYDLISNYKSIYKV